MKWYEVWAIVSREASEAAANYLLERGSPGILFEELAPPAAPAPGGVTGEGPGAAGGGGPGTGSPAGEGPPVPADMIYPDTLAGRPGSPTGGQLRIKGYCHGEEGEARGLLGGLERYLEGLFSLGLEPRMGETGCGEVREEDWSQAWKAYYHPIAVSPRIAIIPAWEEARDRDEEIVIRLDPGMAFGSGDHPTTLGCLRALERQSPRGKAVYDLGCGSGILAIAAALLGAARVTALDNCPAALERARENCRLNGVGPRVTLEQADLLSYLQGGEGPPPGDIVLGNLSSPLIGQAAPYLHRLGGESTAFILSGITRERLPETLSALEKGGFSPEEITREGEWVTLVARRGG